MRLLGSYPSRGSVYGLQKWPGPFRAVVFRPADAALIRTCPMFGPRAVSEGQGFVRGIGCACSVFRIPYPPRGHLHMSKKFQVILSSFLHVLKEGGGGYWRQWASE